MPDLKYDTEAMRNTATSYKTTATTLTYLAGELEKRIDDLKNVNWRSDAGAKFQNMYKNGWRSNLDKYVAVLNEFADQLNNAASQYDTVTAKLKLIEGIEIK